MKICRFVIVIFAMISLAQIAPAATGPAAFLRKLDRKICAEFKSIKCHHKRKKHVSPKVKIEKPSVPVQDQVKALPAVKPVLKSPIVVPPKPVAMIPREKPLQIKPVVPVAPVVPVVTPVTPPSPVAIEQPRATSCLATLKAKQVNFEVVAQPAGSPACVVEQPVQLRSVLIGGAILQLPDHPILNCKFAVQFTSWLQELGGPAAVEKEGSALTHFYTGPGFECRGRNGDTSAKISEHGYGNAVDIERLKFSDGLMILVHDAPDLTAPGYDVLKAMRASACTRFTTVLGPGSNAAHREHFHFDSGTHGKSGTYRICE